MKNDWLTDLIDFYDFIWEEGTNLCGRHVNSELLEDFAKGGNLFEEMKEKIREKYPTEEEAKNAFSINQKK